MILEDIFEPNKVSLISATESIDSSTPGGRAMLSVLATFAQFEREQDAERVAMVHKQLAKECRYLGGPVPLGFKIVDKHYQIDEATAPVVRKLFAMYIAHEGYTAMLNYLNGTGLTTPNGNPFKKNSLHFLLSNEKYIGTYIHNRLAAADRSDRRSSSRLKPDTEIIRIPNGIPAIIDQATWDAACQIREENRIYSGRYRGHETFLLSGLCRCAVCGQPMYIDVGGTDRNGTRQRYYTCHNRCVPAARKEPLEDAAFEVMASAALDEDMLIRACEVANSFLDTQQENAALEISQLKKRASEISRQQANITDAIAQAGTEAPSAVLGKLASLDQEKAAIDQQIVKLQHQKRFSSDDILATLNAVRHAKKLPPDLQKTAVQTAISKVYVTQDEYQFALTGIQCVEMRGVEPLSEGSLAGLSTGVVCDLGFPHPTAHRRAAGISSFILRVSLQSLGVLVPRVNDGGNRTRGQPGPPSRH